MWNDDLGTAIEADMEKQRSRRDLVDRAVGGSIYACSCE